MNTQEQAKRIIKKSSKKLAYEILKSETASKIFLNFLRKPNSEAEVSELVYPPKKNRPHKKKPRPIVCIYTNVFEQLNWMYRKTYTKPIMKIVHDKKQLSNLTKQVYVATAKPFYLFLECKENKLLTVSGEAFLDSFLSNEYVINRMLKEKHNYIHSCITALREYMLFRKFIEIFELIFKDFSIEEIVDNYIELAERKDLPINENIYWTYFNIYTNEKAFWQINKKFEINEYSLWWYTLEKMLLSDKIKQDEMKKIILKMYERGKQK